ncbi:hypothetical protein [Spirosoma sp. 209]|uniref:hypothetical protein n=1 Tax=Spirosoma sp. 209 TaxID=1955701 RepID=UPI00098D43EA|nr:hypothetical protein [Spirosoma sp. 209]
MTHYTFSRRLLMLTALFIVSLTGCNEENPTVASPDLVLASTTLGNVLAGEGGKTLYFFANDADGKANCTGNCLTNWPIFYKEAPAIATGLNPADFTTITRADGTKQTAFRGWPLYYYKNDTKAGDVNGENVGNVWQVAKPTYTVLLASRQLVGLDGKNYTFDQKEGIGNSLYLTDNTGRTLYAFVNDKKNTNRYTQADLSNNATWPIAEVSSLGDIPSALKKSDFGTITAVGKTQLTYKGWPLYYFGNDQGQRGSTKGVSVPRPGVWPVVNATTPEAPLP